MPTIDISMVKELRETTQAGLADCKKALQENDGDMDKALQWLRERGQKIADKKGDRATNQGLIHAYIHPPGRRGVLVEIQCESDFVANHEDFKQLATDVAMQIAATNPEFIRSDDVDKETLDKEMEIFRNQALSEGKPEKIVDKIVEGRVKKYYTEVCLLEQKFVKDPDGKLTIQDLLNSGIQKFGENINVSRFTNYVLGG